MVTVQVMQKGGAPRYFRALKIYVDGHVTTQVHSDAAVQFELTPGKHSIDVAYYQWTRSHLLHFEAQDGDTVSFECAIGYTSIWIWSAIMGGGILLSSFAPGSQGIGGISYQNLFAGGWFWGSPVICCMRGAICSLKQTGQKPLTAPGY